MSTLLITEIYEHLDATMGKETAKKLTTFIGSEINDKFEQNMKTFATKEDIANFVLTTKQDLAKLALTTKDDTAKLALATKEHITSLALTTKDDIAKLALATKEDIAKL